MHSPIQTLTPNNAANRNNNKPKLYGSAKKGVAKQKTHRRNVPDLGDNIKLSLNGKVDSPVIPSSENRSFISQEWANDILAEERPYGSQLPIDLVEE